MKHSLWFAFMLFLFSAVTGLAQGDVLVNVWEDRNGNGIKELGEPNRSGFSVTLYDAGNVIVAGPTNTNAMGNVTFANIPDGTGYYVKFATSGTYKATIPDYSGGNTQATDVDDDSDAVPPSLDSHPFDIAGADIDGLNFGVFIPVEINGNVWLDINGNGQDEGDGPIPQAVDVTLLDDLGNPVTTDADGNPLTNPVSTTDAYSFTNIFPGTYVVQFEEPGGSHPTGLHLTRQNIGADATDSDPDRVTGETANIVLISGDPPRNDVDAGYFVVASISDYTWEDSNGNGVQDGGEPPLAGVEVNLVLNAGGPALDPDGNPIPAQFTDGGGLYNFDQVPPGNYRVDFETNPGGNFYLTLQDQGSDATDSDPNRATGLTINVVLLSGESTEDMDAGYYEKCTIGDFTWEDLNGNGIQDGGEPGIDVDIEITDVTAGGPPMFEVDGTTAYDEDITSSGGDYLFDNLPPGVYKLTFTAPANYFVTQYQQGGPQADSDADPMNMNMTVNITCNSGDEITEYDAGFFTKCTIGDYTWEDVNGDGQQNDGPLGGVTIEIIDVNTGNPPTVRADGTPYPGNSVNSNGAGAYIFDDLPPGEYKLTFIPPGGYYATIYQQGGPDIDSDADPANMGMTVNLTCNSGDEITDIDAGFFEAGEIQGFAFHDRDADGLFNNSDAMLDGITFTLTNLVGPTEDVFGAPVAPQVSAGGTYIFSNLRPGPYTITANAPGWIFTEPNLSGNANDNPDASDDSDFDDAGNLVNDISLEGGEVVTDRAAGLYKLITLGGNIWGEDDSNCNLAGETGGFGVTVELYDEDGALVATATGDVNGVYQFDGLIPGVYKVVLPSTNFVSGAPLYGLESCGCTGGDDDVDNDDNGAGPPGGPIETVDIELLCGLEPGNMGLENTTIDFCFEADCDTPNPLTTPSCGTVTDTICDLNILNLLCTRMPPPPLVGPAPDPLCSNGGAPHNMSWLAFVAGSGDWSIDINIFGCTGGQNGAQIGVLEIQDCDFAGATEIFCIGNPCVTGLQSIPNTNMTPGNTYYLWLDGCAGSVCSYDVEIVGNFIQYQVPDPVDLACTPTGGATACDTICPNTTLDFEALDAYDNLFANYTWTVTDPMGNTQVIATDERFLTHTFGDLEGTYNVELTDIYVKCSEMPITPYSVDIVVANPPDEDFGIHELCENFLNPGLFGPWDGPAFVWNTNINDPNNDGWLGWFGPGGFTQEDAGEPMTFDVVTPDGCEFTQTVEIELLLNSAPVFIDTIMCDGEVLEIGPYSWNFEIPDPLDVYFPNEIGCDSVVWVTSAYLGLAGEIQDLGCVNGAYVIQYVQTENPNVNQLLDYEYIWTFLNNGNIVDDGDPDNDPTTFIVSESGEYEVTVIVTLEDGSKSCQFPIQSPVINVDNLIPPMVAEEGNWGTVFCAGDGASFTYEISTTVDPSEIVDYIWTYPSGVTATDDFDTSITLDWANTNGGPLCMSVQTNCGISPPLCDTIVIIPEPVAALPAIPSVCVDSFAVFSAQGTSQPTFVYNWDFDGGTPVGSGTGVGPHQVAWGDAGLKNIELVINNQNCLSSPANTTVNVVAPVPAPIVNCQTPDIGDIVFVWDEPVGALGYQVQVITGQTGNQVDTTMTFLDLPGGDTVEIIVTTLTNSPCGNLVSTGFCIAQSCIPPQVAIDPVAPICTDANTTPIQLTAQVNPVSNGIYTYSGPGVSTSGLFDPLQANQGVNTIQLQYADEDNCLQFTSINISVNLTPTADFANNVAVICQDSVVAIEYTGNITTGGTFNWEFGPDVKTPGNGPGPFDIGWNTPGQKTIELQVSKNGCVSGTETINVQVDPRIQPLEIDCADQQATEITVAWLSIPDIQNYTLIVDGGAPFNTNGLTHTITGLTPDSEHTFELIANSNNSCPGTSVTLSCFAVSCPPIAIDFNISDTTVCLNAGATAFDLEAIITGGLQTGTGTLTWSGKGVDPVTGLFDPATAGVSTGNGHRITATFKEVNCTKVENLFIKVINQPVASFTGLDKICIDDEYNVVFNGTGGLPLEWTPVAGTTVTPNGVGRYKIDFANAGTYTLGLTVGNTGCQSELFNKTVEVEPALEVIDVNCSVTLSSIEFTWNDIDCVTDYQIEIDGISQGTQSSLNYLISGLAEGEQREIVVTPISDCECEAIPITLTCEARKCPPIQLSLASPQDNFCVGDVASAFQLNANVTNSDGSGSGVWSGNGVTPQGIVNPNSLTAGVYTFNYEFGEVGCRYNEDLSITIFENPSITVSTTNPDCFLDNVGSVVPTVQGGTGNNYSYRLDGNAITLSDLSSVDPGSHIIVVNDGNNCDASANFSIVAATAATISTSGPSLIILGESARLTATTGNIVAGDIDSIVWKNSLGEVVCSGLNCNTITVTPEVDETYCATLFYNDGCFVEDCFTVKLKKIIEIILPNIIRPGDDNNNSFFVEQYENIKLVNSMAIYDRWGNLVFKQENFSPGSAVAWNGKINNKDIVPGVYAYTIDLTLEDDEPLKINGDVTVIR